MSRVAWPFKPISPVLDVYTWSTDIFQAKAAEQRIALRTIPAREFAHQYEVSEYAAGQMQILVRENSGADGFYVPDWTQMDYVGALSSGSSVPANADISDRVYGDSAFVWQNENQFEIVSVTADSNGLEIDTLVGDYDHANIMPAWTGDCPDGVSMSMRGARRISASASFILDAHEDISGSGYDQYRGHDVVPDCPVLVGGLSKDYSQQISTFGGTVGDRKYLRARDLMNLNFNLRWQKFNNSEVHDLIRWISSRYGRQKAFWASTSQQDFEPASAISGTTVNVFKSVVARSTRFDIEVVTSDGTKYRRQVSAISDGAPVDGRATSDLTIDTSITASLSEIERISLLVCSRFDSDRIEFDHRPKIVTVSVPCYEIPVP
jgi:hypothetical protein